MKHFVIVYVSAVQSHFWRIWKLVFNVLFVAPCTRVIILIIIIIIIILYSFINTMNRRYQRLSLSRVSPILNQAIEIKSTQIKSNQIKLNKLNVGFEERGKPSTGEKPLGAE